MVITVSEKEGVIIFRLSGRIISPGIKEISETVAEALTVSSSPLRFVFDFKKVTQIDSFGLGALMKIHSDIHPRQGKIAVVNVNKHVKNLIVTARLITVFESFESEDDAIAALSKKS
ncbi:MAG: STAS domain-containing protein [Candidatus Poribacteria bacterium]|nr:STAS domain-containing protein [Candidatus Poribacteria bacterium]